MSWSPFHARDFDAELEQEKLAQQQTVGISQQEIDQIVADAAAAARDEGYRSGRDDARTEAEGSQAAARIASMEALRPLLGTLLEDHASHREALERDMSSFMATLCEKAMPSVIAEHGRKAFDTEIEGLASRAFGSRWLEVRVSDANRDAVEATLTGLLPGDLRASLRVVADPGLGDRDVEANWQGGRSSMSYDRLCRAIVRTLNTTCKAQQHQEENSL